MSSRLKKDKTERGETSDIPGLSSDRLNTYQGQDKEPNDDAMV